MNVCMCVCLGGMDVCDFLGYHGISMYLSFPWFILQVFSAVSFQIPVPLLWPETRNQQEEEEEEDIFSILNLHLSGKGFRTSTTRIHDMAQRMPTYQRYSRTHTHIHIMNHLLFFKSISFADCLSVSLLSKKFIGFLLWVMPLYLVCSPMTIIEIFLI